MTTPFPSLSLRLYRERERGKEILSGPDETMSITLSICYWENTNG
jgi:hypothetical protein